MLKSTEDTFIDFLDECRENPPVEVFAGQVEFRKDDWVSYVQHASGIEIPPDICHDMLRPYESAGWIVYVELLCWRISESAPTRKPPQPSSNP